MENENQFCPGCGAVVDLESIYCSQCGTNLLLTQKANLIGIKTEIVVDDNLIANYKKLQQTLLDMSDVEDIANAQKAYYEDLDRQHYRLDAPIQKAKTLAGYEKRDVSQLKNFTWTSLKARVKGDRDERISKEEQEYFKAMNEYETLIKQRLEIKNQVELAKSQWNDAQKIVKVKNALENELQALIRKAGESIVHPIEDKLEEEERTLSEKVQAIEHEIFGLKTNHSYAKGALDLYHSASRYLDEAMDMANWDVWGGDWWADSRKRSKLNEARNLTYRANEKLDWAVRGLKDESIRISAHVKDTGFIMDTFFDNIFSDLNARDKIRSSQRSVDGAIRQTGEISDKYRDLISDLNGELGAIRSEYDGVAAKLEDERIKLLEMYMGKQE